MNRSMSRILGVSLALLLSGIPEPVWLLAQSAPAQPQAGPQQSAPQPTPDQPAQAQPQTVEPQPDQIIDEQQRQQQEDKASQQMINSAPEKGTTQLPESPDALRARQAEHAQPPAAPENLEPSGTAAAQQGRLVGGTASRPAGAAIAPAKQKQVHSFLIKMGVIAGAGVALGTVYALSRASSPAPPGAR